MSENICKNCQHYRQHYILNKSRCSRINCGHCKYPRLKHRTPGTPACAHYIRREDDDVPEVIDFFTLERLRDILELAFPPEIVDTVE